MLLNLYLLWCLVKGVPTCTNSQGTTGFWVDLVYHKLIIISPLKYYLQTFDLRLLKPLTHHISISVQALTLTVNLEVKKSVWGMSQAYSTTKPHLGFCYVCFATLCLHYSRRTVLQCVMCVQLFMKPGSALLIQKSENGLGSWWKSICSCNGNSVDSKLSVIVCAAWYGVFTTSLYNTLVCRNEREKYAKHRHKAEKYPTKYMSIIIDGMDQDKTNIPHLISIPKAVAGNYTLQTHITGVRVHGRSTIMFIDCQQFPHDSNLTTELLSRVFLKYKISSTKSS